jgi:hypothetical protein
MPAGGDEDNSSLDSGPATSEALETYWQALPRQGFAAFGRLLIEEPGRVIIQQGGQTIIRHNEADRFRWQAQDVHIERRGADTVTVFERPDGSRIYTMSDPALPR